MFICHAQVNISSDALVSDSLSSKKFFKLSLHDKFEKVKIPLYKKDQKKLVWMFPSLAWNNYDKGQVGLMIGAEVEDKFKVLAAPMYGVGSGNLTGILNAKVYFKSKNSSSWALGLQARRFSYLLFPEDLTYNKINPSLSYSPSVNFKGVLKIYFKHSSIWQEYLLNGRKTAYFHLNTIGVQHTLENKRLGVQSNADVLLGKQFAMLYLKSDLKLKYQKKAGNGFYASIFGGSFLYNNKSSANIDAPLPIFQMSGVANSGIYWLQKDFGFNDFYLDRNARDNFFQKQVANSEGGFKSLTSIGNANSFLFALNLKTDVLLPLKIKRIVNIQPFINFASVKNRNTKMDLFAEGGISLVLFDDFIAFHIPFVTTKNIKENQQTVYGIEKGDWTKRITFSMDLLALKRRMQ